MNREDQVPDEKPLSSRVANGKRERQERKQKEHCDRQVPDHPLREDIRIVQEIHQADGERPYEETGPSGIVRDQGVGGVFSHGRTRAERPFVGHQTGEPCHHFS